MEFRCGICFGGDSRWETFSCDNNRLPTAVRSLSNMKRDKNRKIHQKYRNSYDENNSILGSFEKEFCLENFYNKYYIRKIRATFYTEIVYG